jgi:hypothetical protein
MELQGHSYKMLMGFFLLLGVPAPFSSTSVTGAIGQNIIRSSWGFAASPCGSGQTFAFPHASSLNSRE